jgi:hypothetical protein
MGSALCTSETWIQFASGLAALVAAIVWFLASRVSTPTVLTYDAGDALLSGIRKQSRLNAWAALFAAMAAILQVPLAFMPTCWSNAPWFIPH